MHDGLWGIAQLAAVIVFIVALVQGKGFFNALRMGVGVLIMGVVAIFALGILAGVLKLTFGLLMIALWFAILFGLIAVVARVIKDAA